MKIIGYVDYEKVLNDKQILSILNQQMLSIEKAIKMIHFNKEFPEYNNVFITNMKDDIAYIFNGEQFICVQKNEILCELVDNHINEIELSLDKYKNKLPEKVVNKLKTFLDMLNNSNQKFVDEANTKTYPNYCPCEYSNEQTKNSHIKKSQVYEEDR